MLSVNIGNIAITSVKNIDDGCAINNISKSEAIKNFSPDDYGYI